MKENLLMDEENELRRIRDHEHKKNLNDLNKKNLSQDDLDEIFCEF